MGRCGYMMLRMRSTIGVLRLAGVMLLLACTSGMGAADETEALKRPPWERFPVLMTADSIMRVSAAPMRSLTEPKPITGFAFGPGRNEIAFCAAPAEGPSTLWVVPLRSAQEFRESQEGHPAFHTSPRTTVPWEDSQPKPRLLWTAPVGTALRGPLWWAPNGAHIAARAFAGGKGNLVAVDYVTGEPTWITKEADVADATWSPDARRIAYVDTSSGSSVVWVQSVPPGEAQKLGEGGARLRWTVDRKALCWLRPDSPGPWLEMTWEIGSLQPKQTGQELPRPEGTAWSPDALRCAVLEGEQESKRLVIYQAASTLGEPVQLPAVVHPQQLMGWSPDNRLVMFTADMDIPFAVSAAQAKNIRSDILTALGELDGLSYRDARYSFLGLPMDPEAGPPAWSSDGQLLAYVVAEKVPDGPDYYGFRASLPPSFPPDASPKRVEDIRQGLEKHRAHLLAQWPPGGLVVVPVERLPLPSPEEVAKAQAEAKSQTLKGQERVFEEHALDQDPVATRLLRNARNIGIAVQMYVADRGAFPSAKTLEEIQEELRPYFRKDDYNPWVDPEGSGKVVVRWVLPEGITLEEIEDPARVPVLVIEHLADCDIVAFADGHTQALEKGEWQSLVPNQGPPPD